jgi:ABC-type multidrug transport system fused ATPase/permease subunit
MLSVREQDTYRHQTRKAIMAASRFNPSIKANIAFVVIAIAIGVGVFLWRTGDTSDLLFNASVLGFLAAVLAFCVLNTSAHAINRFRASRRRIKDREAYLADMSANRRFVVYELMDDGMMLRHDLSNDEMSLTDHLDE